MRGGRAPDRERFPGIAEEIGEDPARWLDRDLLENTPGDESEKDVLGSLPRDVLAGSAEAGARRRRVALISRVQFDIQLRYPCLRLYPIHEVPRIVRHDRLL